jgi:hypothetical protein
MAFVFPPIFKRLVMPESDVELVCHVLLGELSFDADSRQIGAKHLMNVHRGQSELRLFEVIRTERVHKLSPVLMPDARKLGQLPSIYSPM